MIAKKTVQVNTEPYATNDDIFVTYELEYKGDVIKPGTKIKISGTTNTFVFKCLAHNISLDSTWIDCWDDNTKGIRAFHVERLKGVVKPKRSRRHKPNE